MEHHQFNPVPRLWRFHLIYLIVTLALSWSIYPHPTSLSVLVISSLCVSGIWCDLQDQHTSAHILAVVIGLGTPVVLLTRIVPYQTILFLCCLIAFFFLLRDHLF